MYSFSLRGARELICKRGTECPGDGPQASGAWTFIPARGQGRQRTDTKVHADSAERAAQALAPVAGHYAATLFAIGLFDAGLLGALCISLATSWALGTSLVPPEEAGRYLGISNLAGAGAGMVGTGQPARGIRSQPDVQ